MLLLRPIQKMKGKGLREERETVITFNEADDTASIWTASDTVYRQLVKRGYQPSEDEARHARFEIPRREIKLPRPKRKMSPKQLEASRKAGLRLAAQAGTGPNAPNGPSDEG